MGLSRQATPSEDGHDRLTLTVEFRVTLGAIADSLAHRAKDHEVGQRLSISRAVELAELDYWHQGYSDGGVHETFDIDEAERRSDWGDEEARRLFSRRFEATDG